MRAQKLVGFEAKRAGFRVIVLEKALLVRSSPLKARLAISTLSARCSQDVKTGIKVPVDLVDGFNVEGGIGVITLDQEPKRITSLTCKNASVWEVRRRSLAALLVVAYLHVKHLR